MLLLRGDGEANSVNKICASCLEPVSATLDFCAECGCDGFFTLIDWSDGKLSEVRDEQ
jgi:hypothetical protein